MAVNVNYTDPNALCHSAYRFRIPSLLLDLVLFIAAIISSCSNAMTLCLLPRTNCPIHQRDYGEVAWQLLCIPELCQLPSILQCVEQDPRSQYDYLCTPSDSTRDFQTNSDVPLNQVHQLKSKPPVSTSEWLVNNSANPLFKTS